MNTRRVGKDYHKFLERLPSSNFIKDNDGFNMAMLNLNDNRYLFCIRVLGTNAAYKGARIIPGNYSSFKTKEKLSKKLGQEIYDKISHGKNFFWQSWTKDINDNSILFIGTLNRETLEITPDKTIDPIVISNLPIHIDKFKYNDLRIFRCDGNIYLYDSYVTSIHQVKIVDKKIVVLDLSKKTEQSIMCKNIRKYDKNWAYLTCTETEYIFLNWFEDATVTLSKVSKTNQQNCTKEPIIKMHKSKINGLGSKTLPIFSFGTPMYELEKGKVWIGVGHCKIITTANYASDKINLFRQELQDIGQQHIQHLTYYYLCYNIVLLYKENRYRMYISDAYLNMLPNEEYIFSINFPLGIDVYNKEVYISMGIGDYYNTISKQGLSEFIKSCRHVVENFNEDDFDYKIYLS